MWFPESYIPYLGLLGVFIALSVYYFHKAITNDTFNKERLSILLVALVLYLALAVVIILVGAYDLIDGQPNIIAFPMILAGIVTFSRFYKLYNKAKTKGTNKNCN